MNVLVLKSVKWLRWVIVPAVVSTALLIFVTPAYAQDPDPIAELTRGLNTFGYC